MCCGTGSGSNGEAVTSVVGQVLNDRYEVLERIGEGGMATAYRGRDRVLGRIVAIKIMRPELAADDAFVARFRREARAAAGVAHEHIASVYDTGSDGNLHYIVMEYVEGESLKERLRREGSLPLDEALRIASETAEALAAAHAAGVVHRDIKPQNILLGHDGRAKVTDFGIARAASSPGQTDTSAIIGSVHYISPEQARGEAVGPQGDIYSLGATLFHMLTGRPPFEDGDRLAILHKHVYDRPRRPSALRPGLPPEVDFVVGHCLAKDLSQRFASARELSSHLAACPRAEAVGGKGRLARWRHSRFGRGADAAGWWVRRRGVWGLAATIALVATVAGVTQWAAARGRAEMVPVPDVVGMSAGAARTYLEELELEYREVGSRPSEDVEAGALLSQDPVANLEVRAGTVVKVVLSEGPSHVVVPAVTQMSVAQAQRNLEAAGLTGGTVQESYDASVPRGYVASTLPAATARVVRGTAVDLVVSLGPKPSEPGGPPPMAPPGPRGAREETLTYMVPADAGADGEADVAIEIIDENGRRRIYQGRHKPGERIPPQKIRVTAKTKARILVDGKVRAEREYLP